MALDEFGPYEALEAEHARVSAELERLIAARQRRLDAAAAREHAHAAWTRGDVAEARTAIHLALDLDCTDAEALRLELEIRAHLREVAARAARDSAVCEHLARSRACLENHRWGEAATEAAQALALDPACRAAAHLAADAEAALHQERTSEDHRALRAAQDAAARPAFEAARAALESGQVLRARWLAEAALAQAPDYEEARRLLAGTADANLELAEGASADAPTLAICHAALHGRPARAPDGRARPTGGIV